jgi:Integrase core domain
LDNAAMESFFSSLKVERVARKTYRTRDQAKADVFDYIERLKANQLDFDVGLVSDHSVTISLAQRFENFEALQDAL